MKFNSPLPFAAVLSLVVALLIAPFAQAVTVTSTTHPSLATHEFSSEIPFAPYQREGGVASGARFTIEDGALSITNAHAGSFGIDAKLPAFDAAKFAHIYFDYLIPPTDKLSTTVKVNVFFRVKGSYHGARFTGPETVRPGSVFLGHIEGVQADGQWHRAHIPLRDWLRRLYLRDDQLQVEEVIIGNWDNTNYLMSGIGGNGTGATWMLDNFSITGVGPSEAKFELKDNAGNELPAPAEYSYTLDDGEVTPLKAAELSLTAENGFHLLRIYDKAKQPVASYGFFVAKSGPQASAPQLVDNTLQVPINAAAGLKTTNIKLTVGDRTFESDSPYLGWDGAAGLLQLKAAQAGLDWKDGENVPVRLEGVEDVLGRPMKALDDKIVVNYAAHKATPPLPKLVEMKQSSSGTFEETLDEWEPRTEGEGAAILERDDSTAASGKYSLRLTSPANSSNFGAWVRKTPFNAGKFPVIEFDYRIPPDVRVDLLLRVEGKEYTIGFTDRTSGVTRLGEIDNVTADNQWHHARVDLLSLLQAARPGAATHEVEWLALTDTGWPGNARGLQYWIDNFQIVPIVQGTPYTSRVSLPDVTGVKALSWVLDEKPDTPAPAVAKASSDSMQFTGGGHRWLHLRAQNGAGHWSETLHVPLALDAAPPKVSEPQPQQKAKAAPLQLEIKVADDTGLDTSSFSLTVQGKQFAASDDALKYNAATQTLSLDLGKAVQAKKLPAFDNNTSVNWKLAPVRDQADQASSEMSGEWTYDYALDKTPPTVTISSSTHGSLMQRDFEDGDSSLRSSNAKLEIVERNELMGGIPNKALRIQPAAADAPMRVRLTRSTNLERHNLFGFHYKLSPKAQVALRLRVGNKWHYIKIAGDAPDTVGEFKNIVADNKWHWAQFDFKSLGDKLGGKSTPYIELIDPRSATPVDAAIEIDNVIMQQGAAGAPRLSWPSHDISGIAKYKFGWSQQPNTDPNEETTDTSRSVGEKSGLWWGHVQAQDNAGNWSSIARVPIIVP